MREERLTAWEGASAEALAAEWGAPAVQLFRRVGSTNDVARRLAAAGAPAGTVVLAEEQLAGRGRVGRGWASPPGLGLWLSIVVRPPEPALAAAVPLLVGIETARALDAFVGAGAVGLKWPNDVECAGRKLAGILCEAAWEGATSPSVVAGLGLNVLHSLDDFPPELRARAGSVRLAAAVPPRRREVAAALVPSLLARLSRELRLSPAELAELESRDVLRGREVVVLEPATGARLASGVAAGVAADGAFLLRGPSGVREVRSGTLRLAGLDE
ncbi:MAG TPA: biotin--[acetyl-CoA-carboxylase] ligase [Longimicrobiaceae bacterium]|nr:biotin--[acetyl-CoA-carboxylase] ligase [Longimicrobiaceae bacterium]